MLSGPLGHVLEVAMFCPPRLLLALSVVFLSLAAVHADEKPRSPVTVVLHLSVKELDPKAPGKASVKVIVRNNGKVAVKVPTVYTAGFDREVILKGGSQYSGMWLVYWQDDRPKQRYTSLAPGKEMLLFEAPLKDLLLDPIKQKAGKTGKARWTWEA
jgi:hypothetical protein